MPMPFPRAIASILTATAACCIGAEPSARYRKKHNDSEDSGSTVLVKTNTEVQGRVLMFNFRCEVIRGTPRGAIGRIGALWLAAIVVSLSGCGGPARLDEFTAFSKAAI